MKQILVVDDQIENILLLQEILRESGCSLLSANSGNKALRILGKMKVDLIVSDLQMEDGDGFYLLKNIHQMAVPPPVIVLTANFRVQEEDVLNAGADAFLYKPYNLGQLETLIKKYLDV